MFFFFGFEEVVEFFPASFFDAWWCSSSGVDEEVLDADGWPALVLDSLCEFDEFVELIVVLAGDDDWCEHDVKELICVGDKLGESFEVLLSLKQFVVECLVETVDGEVEMVESCVCEFVDE